MRFKNKTLEEITRLKVFNLYYIAAINYVEETDDESEISRVFALPDMKYLDDNAELMDTGLECTALSFKAALEKIRPELESRVLDDYTSGTKIYISDLQDTDNKYMKTIVVAYKIEKREDKLLDNGVRTLEFLLVDTYGIDINTQYELAEIE